MAKGFVKKYRGTWYYGVVAGDLIVFEDNCNNWRKIFDQCYADTLIATRVQSAGHTFEKSFKQLVDEASELL